MKLPDAAGPEGIVLAAIEQADIRSAALFVAGSGSVMVRLVAAAGIDGAALDALEAAVRDPAHPIPRTLVEAVPSFDVLPTRPGGPALRSHLPLRASGKGGSRVVGVLAVAHQDRLSHETRQALETLADEAAVMLGPIEERDSSPSG